MNEFSAIDPKLAVSLHISKHALGKFLGKYQSLFRGQGMDYDEIRPYSPGDDPKAFVWAKLAQLQEPYVKTFIEERDLSVCVALDVSGSMFYRNPSKAARALRAAAVLIYSAAISRDRVSLALFSSQLDRFVPPGRGMRHAGTLIEILASIKQTEAKTDIRRSLQEIGARAGSKRGALFIISDFFGGGPVWDSELSVLSTKNDIILLRVFDSFEEESEDPGWIVVEDPESHAASVVYFGSHFIEKSIAFSEEEYRDLAKRAVRSHVSLCNLIKDKDPLEVLHDFFSRRFEVLHRRSRS